MDGNVLFNVAMIGLTAIAVALALWQGFTARRQLRLNEEQQARTLQKMEDNQADMQRKLDGALSEIRDIAKDVRNTVADLQRNTEDRINKVVDLQLDQQRASADQQRVNAEQSAKVTEQFMAQLLGGALGNPGSGPPGIN